MRRFCTAIAIAAIATLAATPRLQAQQPDQASDPLLFQELEFTANTPIVEILAVLGDMAGVSILPDQTVTGSVTYVFNENTFEQAFFNFLDAVDLFARYENGVWRVSRVDISYDERTDRLSMRARNVTPQILLDAISDEIDRTILYDPLPADQLSVNSESVSPAGAIAIVLARFPTYELVTEADYYYVRRTPTQRTTNSASSRAQEIITREGDLFGITVEESARARDVLDELFQAADIEYVSFAQSDSIVQNLRLSPRPFLEALRQVLDQANLDYVVRDGIYVLMELQRRDVLRRFVDIRIVTLHHITAAEFPNLLPSDFSGADLYRIDQTGNRIIFSGTPEEIGPLLEFVQDIDQPHPDREFYRYDVENLLVSDVLSILPRRLASENPRAIPQTNSFVVSLAPELAAELDQFLASVDTPESVEPIHLRFIRSEDLLAHLPPSVSEGDIVQTGVSSLIFFTGSEQAREQFLKELELIDQPVPQIRYQLLVVQYQKKEESSFDLSFENSALSGPGTLADSTFLGSLGQLLSLNFDIVSTLGYNFAIEFNASLGNGDAHVMADTTLNGLSGQEVRFQNTDTFRYRDPEVDPDTGQVQATGTVREITSGLILSVNGWSSGDGMVTMDVAATVSSRGSGSSSSSGDPPTTSERIVNTHVRTLSGTPIVIGGLLQQNVDRGSDSTPFLSQIPLIGWLFRSHNDRVENTELVIYIVPHLELPPDQIVGQSEQVSALYDRFVRPYWSETE